MFYLFKLFFTDYNELISASAEDLSITRIAGLTWDQWNARLAMPLVTQLREGVHPLIFPTDLSFNATKDTITTSTSSTPTSVNNEREREHENEREREREREPREQRDHHRSNDRISCKSSFPDLIKSPSTTSYVPPDGSSITSGEGSSGSGTNGSSGGSILSSTTNVDIALTSTNLSATASVTALQKNNTTPSHPTKNTIRNNIISTDNNNTTPTNNLCGMAGLLSSLGALSGASSGNGGHPCPDCGRIYKLKSSLRNHQKWECGKEPQFQCPFCVYRAKQKMHIGRHMERMHKEKFLKLTGADKSEFSLEEATDLNSF